MQNVVQDLLFTYVEINTARLGFKFLLWYSVDHSIISNDELDIINLVIIVALPLYNFTALCS